jgi:hypothetical protein
MGYTSISSVVTEMLTASLSCKLANRPLLLRSQARPAGNLIQVAAAAHTHPERIKHTDLDARRGDWSRLSGG